MALGTFRGRSRTLRQPEASSSTAQKHADARPRKNSGRHEPIANLPQDSARPKTAEQQQQQRHVQDANPGFDFQIPATPSNAMTSPTSPIISPTDGLIGVALGSPRMVEVPMAMSQEQQFERPPETPVRPSLQRKPSKWKKIGGLFKAKSALSAPVPNQPFYRVQPTTEWPMPASAVSINRRQPMLEESPKLDEKPKPGDNHEKKADPRPDDQPSPIEAWPSLDLEPTPEPTALKHEQSETTAIDEPSQTNNASSSFMPLLQIDLPDIQLERYSVMFGGVLQKNRPSSLNRRSKTLNDADTEEAKRPSPPSPEMVPPRRRATSPTRSRSNSPNFTLFPATQVSKASKVLGSQNIPRGPSPLHKTQTSLAEPHREDVSKDKSHLVLMVHSSPSSHKQQSSVSSFQSATSISPEDERLLLQKLKPVRSYVDEREPEWEIINKKSPNTSEPVPPIPPAIPRPKAPATLTIDTQVPPIRTSADSRSEASSPFSFVSSAKSPNTPRSKTNLPARSPTVSQASTSTTSVTTTPIAARRFPLGDERKNASTSDLNKPHPTVEISIARSVSVSRGKEISIARSVSVSRGKKQVIVPIRPRLDRANTTAADRVVETRIARPPPRLRDGEDLSPRPGSTRTVRVGNFI
ncbi:hypothetical protein ASPACDRAFT_77071 [Aspergillus aculeatus ATCC 16872]|uniref:Uncharacterized protein n=1 Tax=Aspergillus aculeatus (strain ATCC 16872 / CBS 172.66 / WB 5094) TaxID=690307 RepID=A0A1L9WYM0_ASPA1|nr:uncharacterized protein ASPACDRAFT_77071 [Aspergillus aculeatus ATCC 16872]OJK01264.1 hypothetical protein ASPACDRAFT_77071 [Aspergillus aculeatus ATCC 16872]